MTDKLLQFRIPSSFVDAQARLTATELRYGFANHWLTAADVVQLSLNGSVMPDRRSMEIVDALSLLLSDELEKVPELLCQLTPDDRAVWVYLALAWVYEHQSDFADPLRAIEMLYVDFDYPDEMEPFVAFMPVPDGGTPGIEGPKQRWREYLTQSWTRFREERSAHDTN
ncbi:DUF2247 family protein [Nocardia sp. R7R-8]|uniref:DUF2247 family protein n=1 Tax=Nocardia sp. R7R-8 TaxID=3459304 RepID=UPI00403D6269